MKRAMRAVLTMMTGLSLVLAIGVGAAWGRSYWREDMIGVLSQDGRTFGGAILPRGTLEFGISYAGTAGFWTNYTSILSGYRSGPAGDARPLAHRFIGFGWARWHATLASGPSSVIVSATGVQIHDAWLLAVFAALPVVRFYRRVRRGRVVRAGCCRRCGYDLRATPERCPECGEAVG